MTVRAQTRVVGRQKPAPAWPLDRARLINSHNRAMAVAEQSRRQDVSRARSEGLDAGRQDMLRRGMEDADFRKYLFRSMAERLGEMAGRGIGDWMKREIDPMLAVRKRYEDSIMASVLISPSVEMRPMDKDPVVAVRIRFPQQEFHYASILPPL